MYRETTLTRAEVDATQGPLVLQFGANGCGYCEQAQPLIDAAWSDSMGVRCEQVADGPGRPLGRSYRVKLWPTLIFLLDGVEQARVVRPTRAEDITQALQSIQT